MRNAFSKVQDSALKLYVKAQVLLSDDRGQDLIEYVLAGACIALLTVAGMKSFAGSVNNAFANLGTKLTTYTS
jgi:Flp pilus assembly pilin Flp